MYTLHKKKILFNNKKRKLIKKKIKNSFKYFSFKKYIKELNKIHYLNKIKEKIF